MRRLFLIALSSAILLSACGPSKSWPGTVHNGPSQAPATAIATLAATPVPTEANPTEAPTEEPTEAPTEEPTEAPTAAGITFSPPDGSFTVLLPDQPKLTTQTYKTAVGDAPASLWTYEVSNDLAFFVVQASYPKGSLTGASPSAVFDAALNGMVSTTTGAKIVTQGATTLGGHPGRTFVVDTPDATVKGALYIVNDDLYMIYAGYTSAITDMTDADAFLASFEFTI